MSAPRSVVRRKVRRMPEASSIAPVKKLYAFDTPMNAQRMPIGERPENAHRRRRTERLHETVKRRRRELRLDDLHRAVRDHRRGQHVAKVDAEELVRAFVAQAFPVERRPQQPSGQCNCEEERDLHVPPHRIAAARRLRCDVKDVLRYRRDGDVPQLVGPDDRLPKRGDVVERGGDVLQDEENAGEGEREALGEWPRLHRG